MPTQLPTTIEGVLAALDAIIEDAVAADHPDAYFAYVYRRTTAAVGEAVLAGRFDDNERMIRFDVSFANLYLAAYRDKRAGEPHSAAWQLAFAAADARKISILQHVFLGMNAHINLDLGVAAGQLMRDRELEDLADDFRLVNDILAEITDELQERVARISPVLGLLDRLGQTHDEKLLDFSMRTAREQAWAVANKVWAAGNDEAVVIARIDSNVKRFGEKLRAPGGLMRWVFRLIALLETQGVAEVVKKLRR